MRGKAWDDEINQDSTWITPAHAGKRPVRCLSARSAEDHPRACGEKLSGFFGSIRLLGSPPRMRGEAPASDDAADSSGITPAHAGRSKAVVCILYGMHRITPAHAGRSVPMNSFTRFAQDHPRACGEKRNGQNSTRRPQGSPPRMRGEATVTPSSFCTSGITPAHAGRR